MYVDSGKCVGCGRCVPYCPRSAIQIVERKAVIDLELCVECNSCLKYAGCPRGALWTELLPEPRWYRSAFSDPNGKHKTNRMGRGTAEVKTNDVTGIVHDLETLGFAVEVGRPGLGAGFRDFQIVTKAVAPHIIGFEPSNPITSLIVDRTTGEMDPSVMNESVLSGIVEFTCRLDHAETVLLALKKAAGEIESVFSLFIFCKVDPETNSLPIDGLIQKLNLNTQISSAKTNLGLGRPRYEDRIKEGLL